MAIKVSTIKNDLAKVRAEAIKKLIAGKTNNDLLVMMTGCNDIEILSAIYQATSVSKNVTARARFKLAKIWLEKDNRAAGAKKAAEKRKAKKAA